MSLAAVEANLAASPDDPLALAAFADALSDAGDPRGNFLRLQAALDDPASGIDRKRAERELRRQWDANKAAWAAFPSGKVGFYMLDGQVPLARVRLLTATTADELVTGPAWWLLRGVSVDASVLWTDIWMPESAAEELGRFFAMLGWSRVRTLRMRGCTFGDRVLDALLASGLFPRLNELHLPGCGITDDGAEALAAHPHTPKLRPLDLDNNLLSPLGVAALARVGVRVGGGQMFVPGEPPTDPE